MRSQRAMWALFGIAFLFLLAADSRGILRATGNGTAGTADTGVLSVQGIASGTSGAGALAIQGQVGNNIAAAGNPVAEGALGVAKGSAPATITAGNVGAVTMDLDRRVYVNIVHPNHFDCIVSNVTANTQCVGLSGASLSYYITDMLVTNGGTAQNLQVVSSTTAGNACATAPANVTPLLFFPVNTPTMIDRLVPLKVAANSALCCTRSGTTAFSCQISGFIAP